MNVIELVSKYAQSAMDLIVANKVMAAVIGTAALDFSMRMWKTEKPTDVLRAVAVGLKGLQGMLLKVAGLLEAAGALLDKVLPQKLVESKPDLPVTK
jgi:hypothetical protein